jgi:transcriptional regulator with XRE-family HTH domain
MRLQTYRELRGIDRNAAGDAIGVTPHAIGSWERGDKRPDEDNMMAIYIWSDGAVTPDDFYPLRQWDGFRRTARVA